MSRITGKIKWFNATKGFGFIEPNDGSQDVFVHINAVQNSGLKGLNENDIISFELVRNNKTGKDSADHLELVR